MPTMSMPARFIDQAAGVTAAEEFAKQHEYIVLAKELRLRKLLEEIGLFMSMSASRAGARKNMAQFVPGAGARPRQRLH